jgi:hypothetical protein
MNKSEFLDCLIWLQFRMDEYDDKEAYQDDYKIVSMIWSFMRGRIPEEKGSLARKLGNMKATPDNAKAKILQVDAPEEGAEHERD